MQYNSIDLDEQSKNKFNLRKSDDEEILDYEQHVLS